MPIKAALKAEWAPPSMSRNPLKYIVFFLLSGILFSRAAWSIDDPQVNDFALFLERSDSQWVYPSVSRETTTTRLLAVWHESFGLLLKGGLRLAYLDVSQAASPVPSGQNVTGYGLGFDLHGRVLDHSKLQLGLYFAYDYQSTRGKSPDQVSDIVWHSGGIGLDMILAPRSRISLLAGASLTWLDGEQRVSGNINRILPFNEDEPFGYYVGLSLKTDATGSIGLKLIGGMRQGGELVFRRRF